MAAGAIIGAVAGSIVGTVAQNAKGGGLANLLNNIKNSNFFSALASAFGSGQGNQYMTETSTGNNQMMMKQRAFYLVAGLSVIGLIVGLISIFKK